MDAYFGGKGRHEDDLFGSRNPPKIASPKLPMIRESYLILRHKFRVAERLDRAQARAMADHPVKIFKFTNTKTVAFSPGPR